MKTLAEPYSESEVRAKVAAELLELLEAQFCASYVWQPDTKCFDQRVNLHMDPENLVRYEQHYQFHDPITPDLQKHRAAVKVSDVMPQSELAKTEFFNDFLSRDGLHWGVNLFAWDGEENIGDLRIWRDRRREDFSKLNLQVLDLVRPAFVAALVRSRQHRRSTAGLSEPAVLSARESQIARLAASGLMDKQIARHLAISVTTVRTHIEHVFRKLSVSNRTMLAHRMKP